MTLDRSAKMFFLGEAVVGVGSAGILLLSRKQATGKAFSFLVVGTLVNAVASLAAREHLHEGAP